MNDDPTKNEFYGAGDRDPRLDSPFKFQMRMLIGPQGVGDLTEMGDGQLLGLWFALKLIAPEGVEWDVNAARETVKAEMIKRKLPL